MKASCCRSIPRCASCPVRLAAQRRAATRAAPDLVAEIIGGAVVLRPLPEGVVRALEELDRRIATPLP